MRLLGALLTVLVLVGCQSTQRALPKDFSKDDLKRAATAFSIQDNDIKYCPVDGKHFSSRVAICREHQVKLVPVK